MLVSGFGRPPAHWRRISSALLLGARIGRSLGSFRASFLLRSWMFAQQSIVFRSAMVGSAERVCWGDRDEIPKGRC